MMDRNELMQAILRANEQYALAQPAEAGFDEVCLVVTCMDPRLNPHLPAALGLKSERCFFVRNAGATITPHDNSVLRSCALAATLRDARFIVVLGHLGCATACSVMDLAGKLESAGVARSTLDADLRGWFGLIDEPAHAVRRTVQEIARHPAIRAGVAVLGLVIDTDSGRLSEVCQAETAGAASGGGAVVGRMGPAVWDRSEIGTTSRNIGMADEAAPPAAAAAPQAERHLEPIPFEPEETVEPVNPVPPKPKGPPPRPKGKTPPPPPRRPATAAEALRQIAQDLASRAQHERDRR